MAGYSLKTTSPLLQVSWFTSIFFKLKLLSFGLEILAITVLNSNYCVKQLQLKEELNSLYVVDKYIQQENLIIIDTNTYIYTYILSSK